MLHRCRQQFTLHIKSECLSSQIRGLIVTKTVQELIRLIFRQEAGAVCEETPLKNNQENTQTNEQPKPQTSVEIK